MKLKTIHMIWAVINLLMGVVCLTFITQFRMMLWFGWFIGVSTWHLIHILRIEEEEDRNAEQNHQLVQEEASGGRQQDID